MHQCQANNASNIGISQGFILKYVEIKVRPHNFNPQPIIVSWYSFLMHMNLEMHHIWCHYLVDFNTNSKRILLNEYLCVSQWMGAFGE